MSRGNKKNKMKKTLLSTCLLAAAIFVNAQSPTFQWAKSIGGMNDDRGNSLALDASGNIYATGSFRGTVDFDPGAGVVNLTSASIWDVNMFILKLDASGNFVWAKCMGAASGGILGNSIAVDESGNVYTTGSFSGQIDFDPGGGTFNLSVSNTSIFVSKLDASGNFAWAKDFVGGFGYSIAVDASSNVYTTGYFGGTVDFDPGAGTFNLVSACCAQSDIFISKLDASGGFVWAKSMAGSDYKQGNSLAVDASGNVYTTGYFNGTADFDPGAGIVNLTSTGNYDIFISKLNTAGNFVWAKNIGGTGYDYARSMAIDASGNIYTTGAFDGTVDFDPGAGIFNLTSNGGFILKLDASGNYVWAKNLGGTGFSVAVDALGNVYTTGDFLGTADFDPGVGIVNLTSAGMEEIFISKLDVSGNFVWAKSVGDIDFDRGSSIAVNASGDIYTTGLFTGTTDFNTGSGTFNLTAAGMNDIFIQKMGQTTLGANENATTDNITFYPNPANGSFNIVVLAPTKNACIEIFNSMGVLVYTQAAVNEKNTIEFTGQANGIYFVNVVSDNKIVAAQKIIKQ
jgi:hypothetical protein